MTATLFTRQLVADGFISGLVFGMLALGIVLVYRATRVINFAVGGMGLVGAGLLVLLTLQYHVPYWLAVVVALIVGTLYGALLEVTVIRRLFDAPRVIVLVATIGIAQLSLALLTAYPSIDSATARFPLAIGSAHEVASIRITGAQLQILIIVPLVAAFLSWFLLRTTFGKTVKASAENRDLARLNGISPRRVSTFVWAVAGGLATLSIALIAGQTGAATDLVTLGPSTLVRALAAAVIGGMVSFRRAFIAGIVIGVVEAVIAFNYIDQAGLIDFLIFLAILVAVYFQSRRGAEETQAFTFTPKRRPVPERLRAVWWVRSRSRRAARARGRRDRAADRRHAAVAASALHHDSRVRVVRPVAHDPHGMGRAAVARADGVRRHRRARRGRVRARHQLRHRVAQHPGVAGRDRSARVRTFDHPGHAVHGRTRGPDRRRRVARPGVAARGEHVRVRPRREPVLLPAADPQCGPGRGRSLPADQLLRARRAVAAHLLLRRPRRTRARGDGHGAAAADRHRPHDNRRSRQSRRRRGLHRRTHLGEAPHVRARGRHRRTRGRAACRLVAERAAHVVLRRRRLAAARRGRGDRRARVDRRTDPRRDVGHRAAGLLPGQRPRAVAHVERRVAGAPSLLPGRPDPDRVLGPRRAAARRRAPHGPGARRREEGPRTFGRAHGERVRRPGRPGRARGAQRHRAIRRQHRRRRSVVRGRRQRDRRAHRDQRRRQDHADERNRRLREEQRRDRDPRQPCVVVVAVGNARGRGLARTFQAATLFPELTVRETVQLALEGRHRTGLLSAALCLPRSVRMERKRRAEADDLIAFLGLGRYAEAYISDLSTGTRRVVELAGLLALDARVLCLDEPTAGLAERETEAFGPVITDIRRELGASVVVIEHDMPLIMSISDRVYCLELGKIIAHGEPDDVRNDPAVIASYLGADERAIARSGAVRAADVTADASD